jgi:nucleotide-binding universal stress UspA family protein
MITTPERILVATDFSPAAELAQRLAVDLARGFEAELHVVHVQVLLDDPHLEEKHQLELDRLVESSGLRRREAMEIPASETEVPIHTHLVRGLSASEAVVETAVDLKCDLIVMGTHGRRGFTHLLLGSVAEHVVRTARMPVLTVRPDSAVPPAGIRRILVPHDFSDHSTTAVGVAAAWARDLSAEVTLLHAVEPIVYPEFYAVDLLPDEMIDRLRKRSEEALERAAERHVEGVDVNVKVVVGRAGDTIVAEAATHNHELVVMGTRGLSGLEHLLLGSVAENVLRRCALPLLAVREDPED